MPRLPRPYIPLSVRVKVATRQVLALPTGGFLPLMGSASYRLSILLCQLFGPNPYHLDHDPALALRRRITRNGAIVRYDPPANDPDFLVYRKRQDHHIKTNVRGEHGQFCDTVLMKRERRRKKKAAAKKGGKHLKRGVDSRPKVKAWRPIAGRKVWPSRPFPKRRS